MLIITGMSGAGKSRTIITLEDIDYFCVDNVPPMLAPQLAKMFDNANSHKKLALVMDCRSGDLFVDFLDALDDFTNKGVPFKILFLDADDDTLLNRYKETRRKHPLQLKDTDRLESAISQERKLLANIKERADFIVDTTNTPASVIASRIREIFATNANGHMLVQVMSFGFKTGLPHEVDLLFDVRFLPNPFYNPEMKHCTGLQDDVRDFVMEHELTKKFVTHLDDMLDFLIPQYREEGKTQLVIAFGCTGGKHRSVALAQYTYNRLLSLNIRSSVIHRDMERANTT